MGSPVQRTSRGSLAVEKKRCYNVCSYNSQPRSFYLRSARTMSTVLELYQRTLKFSLRVFISSTFRE